MTSEQIKNKLINPTRSFGGTRHKSISALSYIQAYRCSHSLSELEPPENESGYQCLISALLKTRECQEFTGIFPDFFEQY